MRGPYEWIADQGWPEPVELVAGIVATPLILAGMVGGVVACGLAIALVQAFAVVVLGPPAMVVYGAAYAVAAALVSVAAVLVEAGPYGALLVLGALVGVIGWAVRA